MTLHISISKLKIHQIRCLFVCLMNKMKENYVITIEFQYYINFKTDEEFNDFQV